MERRAVISCAYLGFFSQVAQVVVLRELLTAFAGVEMAAGLALCAWLVAAGTGSLVGNRVGLMQRRPVAALQLLYLATCWLLPVTVFLIRCLPRLFSFSPGEIAGPVTTMLGAITALGPLCFLLGLLFVANVRVITAHRIDRVGAVYLLEAAGAAAGGLAVTFIFIPLCSHLVTTLVVLILGSIVVGLLGNMRRLSWIPLLPALVIALVAGLGKPTFLHRLDFASRAPLHGVGHLLAVSDSPYGQISVTRYGEQFSLHVNGALAASYPDPISAEEAVHFALLSHPAPQSVLLIGGGSGGTIGEVLKHRCRLDYAELDPQIIRLVKTNFPAEAVVGLDSCRVIHQDGRRYLSHTAETYDVIILNLGEPSSALVNRFFTREFCAIVKQRLTTDGVFSFRVPSSESYLSPERELLLSSLYSTLRVVFPDAVVLPGPSATFLAANSPGVLIRTPDQFAARMRARGLRNTFVNEYLLPFRLNAAASEYLEQHLHHPAARINTDLQPVCYLYDTVLWSLHFTGVQKQVMARLAAVAEHTAWICFGLTIIVLLTAIVMFRRVRTLPFMMSLFVTGLGGLAAEVVLLSCFQAYLGYIYSKIGLLTACFMVGMSLGSYIAIHRRDDSIPALACCQVLPAAGAVALLTFTTTASAHIPPGLVETSFYVFSLAFGLFGGALFVMANRAFLARRSSGGVEPVGTGYAVDLAGSAVGALVVSSVLIPIWGIPFTTLMIAAANIVAALGLVMAHRRDDIVPSRT